ncbi:TetR/AcrR family transcriptional regulator [Mycobacteroides abscessus]|uniref:TetR/AcrR family transcriptional regulator n=1 Tax=Mycobacteroides abscessus TaxID=36809 RepID=UPI0009D1FBEB|nr:TetR/AcrR family transcriptional regulator [Mycobacteroides abscessus]MDM3946708.1 TetR/AcrR family transcriptional regulator [Mycobacteroides abscessus]SLI22899.1 Putative TetR-family transcriptional regulator [Mycobacteroides abscessus subsp. massiliense]
MVSSSRVYGGVEAPDRQAERRNRLLDAGLDLLASGPAPNLTVRGVCKHAGVVARYFYENFTDLDQLSAEVFDRAIGHVATTTQQAVDAAPLPEKTSAGIANLVRVIEGDPRIGTLMFGNNPANSVIAERRHAAWDMFAALSGQHMNKTYQATNDETLRAVSYYTVGGVGHTLAAWVSGQLKLPGTELVRVLTELLQPVRR